MSDRREMVQRFIRELSAELIGRLGAGESPMIVLKLAQQAFIQALAAELRVRGHTTSATDQSPGTRTV